MKIQQWFCVVAVIVLAASWSNSTTAMTTPPDTLATPDTFATLIGWTDHCFTNLPEYPKSVKSDEKETRFSNKSGITSTTIDDLYTQYTTSKPSTSLPETTRNVNDEDFTSSASSFVQKVQIPLGSTLCFMGDLHGSVHALLRNLLRLYTKSFIADDWKLAPGNYLIFLGDFVDRGSYGTECWWTLMKLASINPSQVILVQGNHEEIGYQCNAKFSLKIPRYAQFDHFFSELSFKIPNNMDKIFDTFLNFCQTLPLAVFLSPIKSDNTHDYVQCSHGGIEPRFNTSFFLTDSENFQFIQDAKNVNGFNWSDFTGINNLYGKAPIASWQNPSYKWTANTDRGTAFIADISDTKEYLRGSTLKAFFRGHQDLKNSFKLVVNSTPGVAEWSNLTRINTSDKTILESNGIPMAEFVNQPDTVPVFTFTTATEARSLDDEGFGIVTMAEDFNQWKIKPHIYTEGTGFHEQSIELLAHAKKKEAFEKTVNNLLLVSSIDLHKALHQSRIKSMGEYIRTYGIPSDQQINTSTIYLKILENKLGMLQTQLSELKTKLNELGAAVTAITTG